MDGLAAAAVAALPPAVSPHRLAAAVHEQFGLVGRYRVLISERDQNFRLTAASGDDYVVKVSSSAEPACVSDFHIAALLHLERAGAAVPRVVRTLSGELYGNVTSADAEYRLRLVSYLPGMQLASVRVGAATAFDFGARLAELHARLRDFSHPGDRPVLLWDMQRALELRDLLHHIDETTVRCAVEQSLQDFESLVVPRISKLRSQVIHGDANPGNVIVEPDSHRIVGFIDFGDMLRAPLVFDIAIAAAYLRAAGDTPVATIAPFIAGYRSVSVLQPLEQELLFDLVRARLATTVTLLYWRLSARRLDDPYREKTLREEGDAVRFLGALDALGRDAFLERIEVAS